MRQPLRKPSPRLTRAHWRPVEPLRQGWPIMAILLTMLLAVSSNANSPSGTGAESAPPALLARPIPNLTYSVIKAAEHPPHFFTQGLLTLNGYLYESSGLYGKSLLARYPESPKGRVQPVTQRLPNRLFAEGLTHFKNRFFLLTWKKGEAWELDNNWQRKQIWQYPGEGWGLTHNDRHLIVSDGTHRLRFYNERFELQSELAVTGGGMTWDRLNELEYSQGVIYANRWHDPRILAINSLTGDVIGLLDLSPLVKHHARHSDQVLNGIAWSDAHQGFWITGKLWNRRYLLKLDQQPTVAVPSVAPSAAPSNAQPSNIAPKG